MIENRDPITEWENAIKTRVQSAVMTLILMAFVCCLVAPVFGPSIKQAKRRTYMMETNYEELAERDMKGIRVLLWIISIISWMILIACNLTYW